MRQSDPEGEKGEERETGGRGREEEYLDTEWSQVHCVLDLPSPKLEARVPEWLHHFL